MGIQKTTLILGAGASVGLGYPDGLKLVELIRETALHDKLNGLIAPYVEVFKSELFRADAGSIDSFIDNRRKDASVVSYGKGLIGSTIFKNEKLECLFKPGHSIGWYSALFRRLSFNDLEKMRIISFNYDRSLEAYLIARLKYNSNLNDAVAMSHFNKIKIIHPFGRLHPLPEEAMADINCQLPSFDYGYGVSLQNRWHLELQDYYSDTLKTAHEAQAENKDVKNIIRDSELVIFLGLSYNELNMNVLGFDFTSERSSDFPDVYGTAYGFKGSSYIDLVTKYRGIKFLKNDVDCTKFFEEHFSFLDGTVKGSFSKDNFDTLWLG